MKSLTRILTVCFSLILLASIASAQESSGSTTAHTRTNIFNDPSFFPIAVWVQQPKNAEHFKEAGINLYVGLWHGPNAQQLETLTKAGMPVICSQNAFALEHKSNPIIAAWMHGDEPDNAQSLRDRPGYGPPILPSVIQKNYEKIRAADPTRPVLLNLGQGVAWDNYIGRGVRRNHPEDYPEYIKGCDIASFDIYPVVHDHKDISGKLEYVAKGVERLREWSKGEKTVWNCIECTHISNPEKKATPDQIRSEVWMALIHGSRGLIYFVHEFKPKFIEAALLEDPVTFAGVARINAQIKELAPVLNSPSIADEFVVESKDGTKIATMTKRYNKATYLFAVCMEEKPAGVMFKSSNSLKKGTAEVLGEGRSIQISGNQFADKFKPYEVHLYRIPAAQ